MRLEWSIMRKKEIIIILHDIRSNGNVGSIFRTSDALGVSKIFLTGYSPAPLDRFGRKVKEIAKTALGAEEAVPWEKVKDVKKLIKHLRDKKFEIIAIEQSKSSVDYRKVKIGEKTVFIFGNEVDGLSKQILEIADQIAEIGMKGDKESLNVSVAFGVALFRILNI